MDIFTFCYKAKTINLIEYFIFLSMLSDRKQY